MVKIEEIREGLFIFNLGSRSIFIKIDDEYVHITQPVIESKSSFKEEDYFGKLAPSEIIIALKDFDDIFGGLKKLVLVNSL